MARRLGIRSPWLTAATWVLFEQLRGRFPFGGLPWGETGAALHDLPTARSVAGVGGVALVSFLVVACNGLLVEVALAARRHSPRSAVVAGAGLALAIGLAPAAWARLRRWPDRRRARPRS